MLRTAVFCIWYTCIICATLGDQPCVPRDYGQGTIVCVCNSTYCDISEPTTPAQLKGGVLRHYVSNKDGKRLEVMEMHFIDEDMEPENSTVITITRDFTYQEILGFGGAMTDSAGINILSLSKETQDLLLQQYYGSNGAGYTLVRVPIGGTDFSTHYYAYDNETVDETLKNFDLSVEDYEYKIPLLKRAQDMSENSLKLFSTAWSAPEWMKESPDGGKHTLLKREYYQLWAEYYIKFLDLYSENNLNIWGITTQNEPSHGRMIETRFNSMGWTAEQTRDWLVGNLGPSLKENGYSDLKIMILDDFRMFVEEWCEAFYENRTASDYVSGMAVHWYTDFAIPPDVLVDAFNKYPNKFILYTESSCDGSALGDWSLAQQYISSIIEVINNGVTGWVDWNLALNLQGGPNWVDNFDNSPILVNATSDEFYKQPMYYAIAHVSKFVPEGSVRVEYEYENNHDLEIAAFITPEKVTVLVIHNPNAEHTSVLIKDVDKGNIRVTVDGYSINTLLF